MEKLGGKNPCDICKKDDCWECLLNSWSKKYYQCLTHVLRRGRGAVVYVIVIMHLKRVFGVHFIISDFCSI